MVILFILSAILISLGKGIADIVSDESNWQKSIFSKYKIDSFFGCKDNTWQRKYRDNKLWNYLFSTILVFTTDIWHLANTISKIGYYLGLVSILLLPYSLLLNMLFILVHLVLNTFLFHIFYHNLLRKSNN
jgi:hypothetical protein